MAALTDAGAVSMLQWLTDQTPTNVPTGPFEVALLTASGDDVSAGTEVSGGGYARQPFTPTAPATAGGVTSLSNNNLIRYENMPGVTVNAFAIYDSLGFRWVHAALSTPRTFVGGDPGEFAEGELVVTGD